MGNNPSINDQQKHELWNRDMSRLFTAAKVVPSQHFSANFIQTILTKGDENENRLICLICNDGKIRGILHSSKSTSLSSSLFLTIVAESQNLFQLNQNDSQSNSNDISYRFTSVNKLSEKSFVVTLNNGSIFTISAHEKQPQEPNTNKNINTYFEFKLTSYSFPTLQTQDETDQSSFFGFSTCIVKYTNESFIAIDHEMTAALCKTDGSIQIIWDGKQLQTRQIPVKNRDTQDNSINQKPIFFSQSNFCCATVYSNYLFAIHFSHDGNWKGLTYSIIKEKTTPLQSFDDTLKTIIAMETYESGIFCLCDIENENNQDEKGRFSVISIDIDQNQIVKSQIPYFKDIDKKVNSIADFKVVDEKKTLLCLTENSIITYSPDIENHITNDKINVTGKFKFIKLASLSSSNIYTVTALSAQGQPNLYILRLSRKTKKMFLETFPINLRLSEGTIKDTCPVDDFTFVTLSDIGELVLYDSLPDWWDIPYFKNIFDDQQH